jgi:preprotein translocase SecE subunit
MFKRVGKIIFWYKPAEGVIVRFFAQIGVSIIWLILCVAISRLIPYYSILYNYYDGKTHPIFTITGVDIPIYGTTILCVLIFVVLFSITLYLNNKPKIANFLIEVEGELKRVAWSEPKELFGTSFVVLMIILCLAAILTLMDKVLTLLLGQLLKIGF